MTTIIRNATALLATVLLAALAGCSPVPAPAPETPPASPASTDVPAPESTDGPAPEPEPTGGEADAIKPDQRIDVLCPDLVTAFQLSTLFGNRLHLQYVEMESAIDHPAIPGTFAVRQLGGMACEWSNGANGSGHQSIRIAYVPDARAEWDYYAGLYGVAGTRDLHCYSSSDTGCTLNSLIGKGWLEVRASGMMPGTVANTVTRISPVVEGIEAAIRAGSVTPDEWSPEPGTLAVPADCAGLIANSSVAAALGLSGTVVSSSGPHGGWGLDAGAARMAGLSSCAWLFPDSDAGVGSLQWLTGGEWAWDELEENYVFDPAISGYQSLPVAGLGAGDSAWVRCSAGNTVCAADLIVGGNWLNIYLWEGGYTPPTDRRTAIATIAAGIVDSLR